LIQIKSPSAFIPEADVELASADRSKSVPPRPASGFLFQSALVQVTQALVQSLRPPHGAAKVINEPSALSYDPIGTLQKRIF
jgi:hypothetical protein